MIYSNELIPFVRSLRITSDVFVYGEPREGYTFHSRMITLGAIALWHHPAKVKVDFDTNFGEYLNLFLDIPPMTSWIEEWQQDQIPWVLDNLEDLLYDDNSPISNETKQDLQVCMRLIEKNYEDVQHMPYRLVELWRNYDLLQNFYEEHVDEFNVTTQRRIHKIGRLRDAYSIRNGYGKLKRERSQKGFIPKHWS